MKESLSKSYNLNGLYYDDRPEFVGLWLPQNKKIGFIGIQAQKWITSHGFSINLTKECLKGFQEIDPCGLLNQRIAVTCAENESTKIIDNIEYVLEETFLNTFKLHKAHMNQYK